jgi:mono/diheme cytochrome c family protein
MNIWVVLPVILIMIGVRFLKPNIITWLALWWTGCFILLQFGIKPPLPSSIVGLFMAILTAALALYGTSDNEKITELTKWIINFVTLKKNAPWLWTLACLIPVLIGYDYYRKAHREVEPPALGRTIHPAPPSEIIFRGKKIDLLKGFNPYRELDGKDKTKFDEHVNAGRTVYYQNCVFCHGDNMQGDGIFAHGFNPQPANFDDATTIAMLQESYLFWRIAKGGPGLPEESAPWASAMPAWENNLSEEQIWDVILFLYSFTDQKPRAQEHSE